MVSLLLLTLDRYQLTRYCLENLLSKINGADFELLILDNGSSDPRVLSYLNAFEQEQRELSEAKKPFIKVHVLSGPTNIGIAAGYNKLIKLATGSHICFVPNDVLVGENFLQDLVFYNSQIDKAGLTSIHTEGEKGVYGPLLNHNDDGFTSVWLPGSNVTSGVSLINRVALEAVGGFDETLGVYGREREQYAIRLHLSGFHNFYVPGQYSVHLGREINDTSEYKANKTKALQLSAPAYAANLAEMKKSKNYNIPL